MDSDAIPNEAITASSEYHTSLKVSRARLNMKATAHVIAVVGLPYPCSLIINSHSYRSTLVHITKSVRWWLKRM